MNEYAAPRHAGVPLMDTLRDSVRRVTGYWWTLLIAGIAWVAAALVILQFNDASMTTVGILVGVMFVAAGVENILLSALDLPTRWVWALFGGLFLGSAVVCFASPMTTFTGLAEALGFLFLVVGVWWMVRAFLERAINPLWWLSLISGIVMTAMAFWTSGAFFIQRAYVLLVFAGVWALMQGITSIVRALAAARDLHADH